MTRCAVLLRGVNVGGSNRISMASLRDVLTGLGCGDAQTYLQSGNAVVSWKRSPAALASLVQEALRDELDLTVDVLVRTAAEIDSVVEGNPFGGEQLDPKLLHAVFLSAPAPALDVESLLPDRVVARDRELYVAYAVGSHGTKAAQLVSSKRFPVIASSRNWRTVLALQELLRG